MALLMLWLGLSGGFLLGFIVGAVFRVGAQASAAEIRALNRQWTL